MLAQCGFIKIREQVKRVLILLFVSGVLSRGIPGIVEKHERSANLTRRVATDASATDKAGKQCSFPVSEMISDNIAPFRSPSLTA